MERIKKKVVNVVYAQLKYEYILFLSVVVVVVVIIIIFATPNLNNYALQKFYVIYYTLFDIII
jgi:hypothetical protein